MYANVVTESNFWSQLVEIDRQLQRATIAAGCPQCEGALHVASPSSDLAPGKTACHQPTRTRLEPLEGSLIPVRETSSMLGLALEPCLESPPVIRCTFCEMSAPRAVSPFRRHRH